MTDPIPPKRVFPPARDEAAVAEHSTAAPQTRSPAYRLAFQDLDFLLREDLRPVRFQLELLKPELFLEEAGIASTFVFYGSARIPEPDKADALIAAASTEKQRRIAERLKAKSKYYEEARRLARLASRGDPRCGRPAPFRRLLGRRPVDHGGGQSRRRRTRAPNRSASTSCCRTSRCRTPMSRRR